MRKILWLAAAGALGTVARAGLSTPVQRGLGLKFPWGTLTVNVLGCFMFGLVWAITEGRGRISPELRFVILVGFMGAFTTFSSYAFDTGMLAQDSRPEAALGNVVLQNAVGILCLLMGLSLGKAWSPTPTATAAISETAPAAAARPDEGWGSPLVARRVPLSPEGDSVCLAAALAGRPPLRKCCTTVMWNIGSG